MSNSYTSEPVRVCDRCVANENEEREQRRRVSEIERSRERQLAAMALESQRIEREEALRVQRIQEQKEKERLALEMKHFGLPKPKTLVRRASLDNVQDAPVQERQLQIADLVERATSIMVEANGAVIPSTPHAIEECPICLEDMEVGNALIQTACGHSFHWKCLKDIQKSDSSNYEKCPTCRYILISLKILILDFPHVCYSYCLTEPPWKKCR